jgi:hypothetical protein
MTTSAQPKGSGLEPGTYGSVIDSCRWLSMLPDTCDELRG